MVLQRGEPFLGPPMRDDLCARILERLAAGDVIVVVVAVDQILDRLLGDLADFVEIGLSPPVDGRS